MADEPGGGVPQPEPEGLGLAEGEVAQAGGLDAADAVLHAGVGAVAGLQPGGVGVVLVGDGRPGSGGRCGR